jgi:uncharacterized protein YceK
MVKIELISKMVGCSSIMTQLIAQEDFRALVVNIYTNYGENSVVA